MNKYYIAFETQTKKHFRIRDTKHDMNTFKGLIKVIKELEDEFKSPVVIYNWKKLK